MTQYVSPSHRLETVVARLETFLLEHPVYAAEYFNADLLKQYVSLLSRSLKAAGQLVEQLKQLQRYLTNCLDYYRHLITLRDRSCCLCVCPLVQDVDGCNYMYATLSFVRDAITALEDVVATRKTCISNAFCCASA